MLVEEEIRKNPESEQFCKEFLHAKAENRLILGRNIYAKGIADTIEVGAFIDDYTDDKEYLGKPVIKTDDVPKNALVVSSLLGRPLAGEQRLNEIGVKHLDYFAFYEDSGLDLPVLRFWGGFKKEYELNRHKFIWVESLLADEISKDTYKRIISLRLSGNLSYMVEFTERQAFQYFEGFLKLDRDGEVFADVGGFDGYTSLEFIKKCPGYDAVYFFEPDAENMAIANERLSQYKNIHLMQMGLSDRKETVRFASGGSVSAISKDGDIEVAVDALDNIINEKVTFIKMDIEGAEKKAINGARRIIKENHPKMALCVYHKDDDFWKIPELVFSIRDDYSIYLRHYTEGVAETVMFFIPK